MKRPITHLTLAALMAALLGTSAQAADAPKPEKLIQWRQSAYRILEWNSARIKAALDGQYNKNEVVSAANIILAIANAGVNELFAPGTEEGKGWHETSARPEIFKERAHFSELGGNFSKEATELARIAPAADAATVKAQFGKLTRTCKACHDDFKGKD